MNSLSGPAECNILYIYETLFCAAITNNISLTAITINISLTIKFPLLRFFPAYSSTLYLNSVFQLISQPALKTDDGFSMQKNGQDILPLLQNREKC